MIHERSHCYTLALDAATNSCRKYPYMSDKWTNLVLVLKVGWFPSNYTQEEIDDPHTYCMAENVLDIMVALYPFKAQNDTELSFNKGDRLEVLDRPASDPEWFKVWKAIFKNFDRVQGMKSYIKNFDRVLIRVDKSIVGYLTNDN